MDGNIAVIGAGMMGEALLSGLLRAGWEPGRVVVAERRESRVRELRARYGVEVTSPAAAVAGADLVALVVKPVDVAATLAQIGDHLAPGAVVVSLAAGITTADLEAMLPAGTPVVRVMPNTPALVGAGMSALCAGSACDEAHLAHVQQVLQATGSVVQVPERLMDAVTAVSGSGPAYVFYVVEALVEAGVAAGLPRETATELTVQTLYGSARMLLETGTHPAILREQVTSPAGTTGAALRQLDERGVRAAVIAAVEAARDRSGELSSGRS